jgi:hypothetical protein
VGAFRSGPGPEPPRHGLATTNGLGANLEHENIALDCEQSGSLNAPSSKSPA